MLFSKNTLIVFDAFTESLLIPSGDDHLSDLPIHGAWECDDITRISFEKVKINPRTTIVVSFELWESDELDEVPIARMILRKEDDLIEFIVFLTIGSSLFRDRELDSDDGLHSMFSTGLIEFESSIEIPCIRDGNGGLTEFDGSFRELHRISECPLESIVCMGMEMDEWHKKKLGAL